MIKQLIGRIPMFSGLTDDELRKIADIAIIRHYRKSAYVFMEGEERHSVYYINKGLVKISKVTAQGHESIVAFLKVGELFPHTGFYEDAPYPGTAEVAEDAELCVIPVKALEQVLMAHPEITVKIMRMMGRKIRELQATLQELSNGDVHYRIASLLLRLADDHGRDEGEETRLHLKVTHSDLAKMAGTTRETVNRFLHKLEKDEILSLEGRAILIKDRAALEDLIG